VEPCDRLVGLDAASGPARQLATCLGRPADELGDGVEVDAEDVVQHERGPLSGAELFEHNHQRHAHRVVEGDPICEIDVGTRCVDDWLGEPWADIGPLDPLMGPEAIDAQPGGHRDQPPADVVEGLDVDREESAVCLLHHVLGVVDAAEHAVGDIEHSPAVLVPDLVDPGWWCWKVVHVIEDDRVGRIVTSIAMSHRRRAGRPSCCPSTQLEVLT